MTCNSTRTRTAWRSTIPRSREAFDAHWAKALAEPGNTTRAVLFDGKLVGYVSCYPLDGQDHVGYWIDRAYWGKGIASRALHLLLQEVAERPLRRHRRHQ